MEQLVRYHFRASLATDWCFYLRRRNTTKIEIIHISANPSLSHWLDINHANPIRSAERNSIFFVFRMDFYFFFLRMDSNVFGVQVTT